MAAAGTTCVAEAQQEEEGMQQEPSGGGGDTWAHFVRRSLGEQRANRDVLCLRSRQPFLFTFVVFTCGKARRSMERDSPPPA